ncbi:MAG TPA: hypothetical protein VJ867_06965 [Gemmatimonadaceae bacterium]|nr:hypothetical protein [Gemmatimonadaceae bacterium]
MMAVVDRAAVEALVERRRATRETGFVRWFLLRFGGALVLLYAIAVAIAFAIPSMSLRALSGWSWTVFLAVPAFMAFLLAVLAERLTFNDDALDAARLTSRIEREVALLTGEGWPMRMLTAGLVLAVCIGVPIGYVVFRTGRPVFIARASDVALIVFASAVLALSIVIAFMLRAATLSAYRDVVDRREDGVI